MIIHWLTVSEPYVLLLAILVNAGSAVRTVQLNREYVRLNRAWLEICLMAWRARHTLGPLSVAAEEISAWRRRQQ